LNIAARDGKFENEGWRLRKDGTTFWAHVVIEAIRDKTGELIGFAKITHDSTEYRESQRVLEQTKEALFQAQKMEAIGQLTGGVAHDFNNLLSAIVGSLEILRKHLAEPKLLTLVDTALQGAKRGAALTQRMLAFARRQDLKAERIEVPVLVHSMSDIFQRSVGAETVIETRFPLRLPAVMVDGNQLESALLNLVVNARDAITAEGNIIIGAHERRDVGDSSKVDARRYVCVYVSDNGEGMDEETVRRAAEPFYTTKGVGKGTGLGLSMVQGLVEQSGGKLIIKSCKGEGTTIELCFPAAEEAGNRAAPNTAEFRPGPSRSLSVLAVDDDSLVLMNTVAMLEDLGHTTHSANSGTRALEALRAAPSIELVITDQAMPGMTGLALADRLRAEFPALPIIIATGYAELPSTAVDLVKLEKPFMQNDLAKAIDRAMAANWVC
jgi:signal transduction histidine kinase